MAENYTETPSDSQNIVEAIAKAVVRPMVAESISFAESISKVSAGLGLVDNQTFAEEITKNAVLGKTDTLSIAEAVAKAVGLVKADSQSIAESEYWSFNKIITDRITPFDDGSVAPYPIWWGKIKWMSACHGGI